MRLRGFFQLVVQHVRRRFDGFAGWFWRCALPLQGKLLIDPARQIGKTCVAGFLMALRETYVEFLFDLKHNLDEIKAIDIEVAQFCACSERRSVVLLPFF